MAGKKWIERKKRKMFDVLKPKEERRQKNNVQSRLYTSIYNLYIFDIARQPEIFTFYNRLQRHKKKNRIKTKHTYVSSSFLFWFSVPQKLTNSRTSMCLRITISLVLCSTFFFFFLFFFCLIIIIVISIFRTRFQILMSAYYWHKCIHYRATHTHHHTSYIMIHDELNYKNCVRRTIGINSWLRYTHKERFHSEKTYVRARSQQQTANICLNSFDWLHYNEKRRNSLDFRNRNVLDI